MRTVITADHPHRAKALRDLHSHGEQTGTVYYRSCALCGHTEWSSSKPGGDLLVVEISERPANECPACNMIFTRNPEFAHWVQNVVMTQIAKMQDRLEG